MKEINELCSAGKPPASYNFQDDSRPLTERFLLTIDELTDLVDDNPSLRSFVYGYSAEFALQRALPELLRKVFPDARFEEKPDDHDRENKGDVILVVKDNNGSDVRIVFESKALQTNSVKVTEKGYKAIAQVDASDRRTLKINGEKYETTCLKFGEFDILAVPLFGFFGTWEFAFALNSDLTHTTYHKVPERFRKHLIKSSQTVIYPLEDPFTMDISLLVKKFMQG
jgi:hypothetical protein